MNPIKIVKTKFCYYWGSNSGHLSDKQKCSPLYYNDLWNIITRVTSGNTHHCTTTTTSKNILFVNTQDFINHFLGKVIQFRHSIKIVKTKLNLLLLRIKLRPLEWQARMFTLVLQRPIEHNNSSDKWKYSPLYQCNDLWKHIIC